MKLIYKPVYSGVAAFKNIIGSEKIVPDVKILFSTRRLQYMRC